ncbi:MAG TPA: hypothetical protein VEP90_06195, partial [Methylomirabilota bacterium]|nr:hypothetical protein [Methylomirabilota bacterium]
MNKFIRRALNIAITDFVKPEKQRQILEDAYETAAPFIRAAVEKKYPTKDMEVCKKYDLVSSDDCIKVQCNTGEIDMFNFKDETGPLVVSPTYTGTIYPLDVKSTKAFHNWKKAKEKLENETEKRQKAYRMVIGAATYLDDITAIWPEAVNYVPQTTALPVPIHPDQIAIVMADQRERGV